MYRRGDASAAVNEVGARELVDVDYRAAAKQAAKLDPFTGFFSGSGNKADGGCLVVDHADRHFVGHDAADCGGWSVAGNRYHVKADRANASHGLQFFQANRALLYGVYHSFVFAYGDECAAKAADVCAGHYAALLYHVGEHGQGRSRSRSARAFQADFFSSPKCRTLFQGAWRLPFRQAGPFG